MLVYYMDIYEIIEKSLFQHLDFPEISAEDYIKLHELEDLLMEIQGAEDDGFLAGLSYLNTSQGIGPTVDKLQYWLSNKWLSPGSFHIEQYNGQCPPFEYFITLCYEAKKRNDQHFIRQGSSITATRPDKSTINNSTWTNPFQCPKRTVHYTKTHPLKRCRTSRNKLPDDRKCFLTERNMF